MYGFTRRALFVWDDQSSSEPRVKLLSGADADDTVTQLRIKSFWPKRSECDKYMTGRVSALIVHRTIVSLTWYFSSKRCFRRAVSCSSLGGHKGPPTSKGLCYGQTSNPQSLSSEKGVIFSTLHRSGVHLSMTTWTTMTTPRLSPHWMTTSPP